MNYIINDCLIFDRKKQNKCYFSFTKQKVVANSILFSCPTNSFHNFSLLSDMRTVIAFSEIEEHELLDEFIFASYQFEEFKKTNWALEGF